MMDYKSKAGAYATRASSRLLYYFRLSLVCGRGQGQGWTCKMMTDSLGYLQYEAI